MNVYTSDGLLLEQTAGTGVPALATAHGQHLISIYRLFLQLHLAGSGDMRIKDMLKPDADDATGESSAEKTSDRRGHANRGATMSNKWSSMPSVQEAATAYTGSAAAVSTGTPYPMFLLSANAIPETHRLRGFPSRRPLPPCAAGSKNNNRSANGSEEIPVRWSLLAKQTALPAYGLGNVSPVVSGGVPVLRDTPEATGQHGHGDKGGMDTASGAAASLSSAAGETLEEGSATIVGETGQGEGGTRMPAATSVTATATAATTAASSAATISPCVQVLASGWVAAELQVHTTHRVLVCTATELRQTVDSVADDGDAPLVFCCCVHSASS